MNFTLDPALDTSRCTSQVSYATIKCLKKNFQAFHLVDVWRILHPDQRDYTFYSHPHDSYTRIDFFMLPQSLLSRVTAAAIGSITFSDHAPILVDIDLLSPPPKQWMWKINDSLLINPEIVEEISQDLRLFFAFNAGEGSSPMMVWEVHKSYIRGLLIKIESWIKKARAQEIIDILAKIRSLESIHKQSLSNKTLADLPALRSQLLTLALDRAKATIIKCRRTFYEHSDKCGKLLARFLRAQQAHTFIPELLDKQGTKVHETEKLADIFRQYYTSLYNLPKSHSFEEEPSRKRAIQDYISRSGLLHIPEEDLADLDRPISAEEVTVAIAELKSGKAPGLDGYSPLYYKTFGHLLTPHFLLAYNAAGEGTTPPRDTLRAHIAVIPKEGKDPLLCQNYRPISLLNMDLKIFTKILALRLIGHIPQLIHLDQVGFVPLREARDNTTKALNLIYAAQRRKIPLLLLSTDAKKAFDRVDWTFLTETLCSIGLGQRMLHWVHAIY